MFSNFHLFPLFCFSASRPPLAIFPLLVSTEPFRMRPIDPLHRSNAPGRLVHHFVVLAQEPSHSRTDRMHSDGQMVVLTRNQWYPLVVWRLLEERIRIRLLCRLLLLDVALILYPMPTFIIHGLGNDGLGLRRMYIPPPPEFRIQRDQSLQ